MKVLITGAREWSDIETIAERLSAYMNAPNTTVIHGGRIGADIIAGEVAKALGFIVRDYPVSPDDWKRFGKRAGVMRNQLMLDKEHLPTRPFDICLAFHDDIVNSCGTKDMMSRAAKIGIPCQLYTSAKSEHENA
jgi:hypothetical protein